ncbi:MAG: hypothetical protein FD165_1389 [Gammaproteobacteria bacterium]|nr:MAG: hypothetical protein FD165_1389 [Gammaproteobacteria bacterium]TND04022.1 MAG: hypothetical protein FD120_1731 [Gammaproteobacteria bacterium]
MTKFAMANHAEISAALQQIGSDEDAAGHHGTLCGLLCVDNSAEYEAALAPHISGIVGTDMPPDPELTVAPGHDPLLDALRQETLRQLRDPELSFRLLLPADELPLNIRMEALMNWCKGFLYGLGTAGFEDFDRLPDEINEFMQDLIDLTRTDPAAVVEDEEEENAYVEIVEYLRIGVLLLHAELQHLNSDQAPDEPVIH